MAKKIKKSDLITIIDTEIHKSSVYNTKISKDRATATKYYYGKPFGGEKRGRSTYVSSEVQETISWILPQIMKVFSETDVVRFDPQGPGDELNAELATEFCKYILYKKNPGFLILHNFIFDALLQQNGVLKVSYVRSPEYIREEYAGLTDLELTQLLQDDNVEPIEHETTTETDPFGVQTNSHDVTITRKKPDAGKIVFENVPPEELVVTHRARSLNLNEAPFIAQQVLKTISWLRQQGWKVADDIQDSSELNVEYSQERIARKTIDGTYGMGDSAEKESPVDPAQREVWVTESYFKCDYNNDGISEMLKVIKVGTEVLDVEEVTKQPFITTSPFPTPHKWNGQSLADIVKDIQLLKSHLMRAMLDSFAFGINPSKVIDVTKMVDINDILDTNPGNYIRMRGDVNNAFTTMPTSGVGESAFQLLGYMDDIAESRSGVSKMTQGIDQNVYNKTATATNAIMSASQEKIAMIVRIFAETGIGEIYKKIIQLASEYADSPELIQIDNNFTKVDPRKWTNLNTITVCVGTGALDRQAELANINQIIQLQQTLGAAPIPQAKALVGPDKVYNALSSLIKGMGYKNSGQYFNDPQSPEYAQVLQIAQQASQPAPDPQVMMAHIANDQVQQDMLIKTADFELQKLKADREFELRKYELQLKYELEAAKIDQKDNHLIVNSLKDQLNQLGQLEPGSGLLPQSEIAALQSVSKIQQSNQPQQPPEPPPPDPHQQNQEAIMAMMQHLHQQQNKPPVAHKVVRGEDGRIAGIVPVQQQDQDQG